MVLERYLVISSKGAGHQDKYRKHETKNKQFSHFIKPYVYGVSSCPF